MARVSRGGVGVGAHAQAADLVGVGRELVDGFDELARFHPRRRRAGPASGLRRGRWRASRSGDLAASRSGPIDGDEVVVSGQDGSPMVTVPAASMTDSAPHAGLAMPRATTAACGLTAARETPSEAFPRRADRRGWSRGTRTVIPFSAASIACVVERRSYNSGARGEAAMPLLGLRVICREHPAG